VSSNESRRALEEKSRRPLRPLTVVVIAVLLLVPPLLLIITYAKRKPPRQVAVSGPSAGAEPPSFRRTADASEPSFGGMKEPRGAAVDSLGRLWVADFGNSRLRLFDSTGGYLGGWGGPGNGTYGFHDPCAVAIRGEDLYVADTWNGRIQSFTISGQWKATIAGLSAPRGIATAGDGTVWVSDTGNHRVIAYDALLRNPREFGKKGSGPGEFAFPIGITVDASGRVFIADTGNHRVVRLGPDGRFQTAWPVPGWERPGDAFLAADVDGSLYVTDPGQAEELLKFDPTGGVVERRSTDDNGNRFSLPTGLALDPTKRVLYVVSSGTNAVSAIRLPERPSDERKVRRDGGRSRRSSQRPQRPAGATDR